MYVASHVCGRNAAVNTAVLVGSLFIVATLTKVPAIPCPHVLKIGNATKLNARTVATAIG